MILKILGNLFRKHGYHGTTYSHIQEASGLGKGSLYHHFSEGKDGIARAVILDVQTWFEEQIYQPLESSGDPPAAIDSMFQRTLEFFEQGERVCVPGSFALHDARDVFSGEIQNYFERWVTALTSCLITGGLKKIPARELAIDTVSIIQGGLVVGRALHDPTTFQRILERQRLMVLDTLKKGP